MNHTMGGTVPESLVSELVLSDRLLSLAEAADHAGYSATAEQLITLACTVFDDMPKKPH